MAKHKSDNSSQQVDQFMRIAKYAPKSPKQPVTLEEQIAHQELLKRERYVQEEKDRKQRDLDREAKKNRPVFSGRPEGIKAEMEYLKKQRELEANKKK